MKLKLAVGITLLIFGIFVSAIMMTGWATSRAENHQTQPSSPPEELSLRPQNTVRDITIKEVSTHATASDCWIIIEGKVYGISAYLDSHPGGVEAITPYCGKEATQAFQTKGNEGSNHSAMARELLTRYLVGTFNQQ